MGAYPKNYLADANNLQGLVFKTVASKQNNDFAYFVEHYMNCIYRQLLDSGAPRVMNMTYDELLAYLKEIKPAIFKKGRADIDVLQAMWIGEVYNELQFYLKISSKKLYEKVDLETMMAYFRTLHTIDQELAVQKIIKNLNN